MEFAGSFDPAESDRQNRRGVSETGAAGRRLYLRRGASGAGTAIPARPRIAKEISQCDVGQLDSVRQWLGNAADSAGIDPERRARLQTACQEAFVNCIMHGSTEECLNPVVLSAAIFSPLPPDRTAPLRTRVRSSGNSAAFFRWIARRRFWDFHHDALGGRARIQAGWRYEHDFDIDFPLARVNFMELSIQQIGDISFAAVPGETLDAGSAKDFKAAATPLLVPGAPAGFRFVRPQIRGQFRSGRPLILPSAAQRERGRSEALRRRANRCGPFSNSCACTGSLKSATRREDAVRAFNAQRARAKDGIGATRPHESATWLSDQPISCNLAHVHSA